jgi:hypothetical protein
MGGFDLFVGLQAQAMAWLMGSNPRQKNHNPNFKPP